MSDFIEQPQGLWQNEVDEQKTREKTCTGCGYVLKDDDMRLGHVFTPGDVRSGIESTYECPDCSGLCHE